MQALSLPITPHGNSGCRSDRCLASLSGEGDSFQWYTVYIYSIPMYCCSNTCLKHHLFRVDVFFYSPRKLSRLLATIPQPKPAQAFRKDTGCCIFPNVLRSIGQYRWPTRRCVGVGLLPFRIIETSVSKSVGRGGASVMNIWSRNHQHFHAKGSKEMREVIVG